MMSRLQQHQQPHKEGLALCHRVTLDSVAHPRVPVRTPTVHWCPTGKAVGGPHQAPQDDHRQTTTRHRQGLEANVLSATSAATHLESYKLCRFCLPDVTLTVKTSHRNFVSCEERGVAGMRSHFGCFLWTRQFFHQVALIALSVQRDFRRWNVVIPCNHISDFFRGS